MLNIDQSVLAITSFILKSLTLVSYRDKDLMLRNVDVTFDAPGSIQVRTKFHNHALSFMCSSPGTQI